MKTKVRQPIVKSLQEYHLPIESLKAIAEGFSVIDAESLPSFNKNHWQDLLSSYGFESEDSAVQTLLRDVRDQSHVYIESMLLPIGKITQIPDLLKQKKLLDLLQIASQKGPYQKWACSLLRIYHAHVHALFFFDLSIQNLAFQELQGRLNRYMTSEIVAGTEHYWFGDDKCRVPLLKIQYKDQKTVSSIVTKILHKPANMAHQIYDRIGVRLVVSDTLSAALLLNFLHSRHVLPFFHLLPGQSENSLLDWTALQNSLKNTLKDNSSRGTVKRAGNGADKGEIKRNSKRENIKQLHRQLADSSLLTSASGKRSNPHTLDPYRSVQFTSRLLIQTGIKPIKYHFYPFEVQIFDSKSWQIASTGAAAHHRYRFNQIKAVRRRVFPWLFFNEV